MVNLSTADRAAVEIVLLQVKGKLKVDRWPGPERGARAMQEQGSDG